MTKDDLIRMAALAGYDVDDDDDLYAPASGRYGLDPRLEKFAKLVAEYALKHEYPVKSYTGGVQRYAANTSKREQGCAECGVKASEGYALYCVDCTELFTQPEKNT